MYKFYKLFKNGNQKYTDTFNSTLDPEYHARHIPHRDRFENMWRDLIQEGVDTGVFSVENIPLTVRGLMGVMNWTITWYRPAGELSIDEISDHFANVFLNGLKK